MAYLLSRISIALLVFTTLDAAEHPECCGAPTVLALKATLAHVEGIDVEGPWLWVTSVDRESRRGYLHLFELRTGRLIRQVEVQDGDRFHPGGISLAGDAIWVPVAEYRRASTSVIQKRDKRTLELLASFPVPDHIGCIAAGRDRLIGGNWDSRDLYEWDLAGRLIQRRANPSKTSFQDMKRRGRYLIASGPTGPDSGAVEWLDWPSLRTVRSLTLGVTDKGVRYTNEGMTVRGEVIYVLPEDGASRLFSFRFH